MKKTVIALSMLIISQWLNAADFNVPTVSRCLADLAPSNTENEKVYNIHSDFYYEYEDKRAFAVKAISELARQYSTSNSECQSFTQPMNRTTVQCQQLAGSDVCIVPSDAGEFIVVKDYVDSTQIVLTEYSDDYSALPTVNNENDYASLYLPQPELCYSDLLKPIYDSQAHQTDARWYKSFSDLRFVFARSNRDLIKSLAEENTTCDFQTAEFPAHQMQCIVRNNKPGICGMPATGGGYFIYVTDSDFKVHMLFNRWD